MSFRDQLLTKKVVAICLLCMSSLTFASDLSGSSKLYSGEVLSIKSAVLKESREIYISLPESYQYSTHQYPVIFVLDGEYLFSLANSIVKHQASRNYMPESIVVGLPNSTGKRMEMAMEIFDEEGEPFFYGENLGQTATFLKFVKQELLPKLEKEYRINDHRTIIGMSPTFGPVLEAFWNEPDLFSGYIVLAAEIGKYLKSGEKIADRLLRAFELEGRSRTGIYVGTSSKDIAKRGAAEAKLYLDTNATNNDKFNKKLNYKFEIVPDEDHYGMAVKGIHHGLRTIYPADLWDISYRDFWRSKTPAKLLKETYKQLTSYHGFDVVPIESAFYSVNNLVKTAEILERQKRTSDLKDWLDIAIEYYPHSPRLLAMQEKLLNE